MNGPPAAGCAKTRFGIASGSRWQGAPARRLRSVHTSAGATPPASPEAFPKLEVHVSATRRSRGSGLLRLVRNDRLGRQEQRSDGRGVLQRRTHDLGRVRDAGGEHVDILTSGSVETVTNRQAAHLLHNDATLEAGVDVDLAQRCVKGDLDDVGTGRLVTDEVKLVERGLAGLNQSHATTGDDALLDGRLRVAN